MKHNNGFTLIELSIVLVIIGLVIGGVIAGRDMINSATIRSQISQIQGYQSAVNAFENKYNYLPGDLVPSIATQFGFTARAGTTSRGDGNGMIDKDCNNGGGEVLGCESALFWRDLSYSGMIDDSFNSATDALITVAVGSVGDYSPAGKIKGNFIETGYTSSLPPLEVFSNRFLLKGVTSYAAGIRTGSNNVTPQDGMNIDLKIDDGKPLTGSVLVQQAAAAPAAGVCVTTAAGNPYNTSTTTYANTNSCAILFKF